MMVTWVTQSKSENSIVDYGENTTVLNNRVFGWNKKWEVCGWKKRYLFIHRVKLEGLTPGKRYGESYSHITVSNFYVSNFEPLIYINIEVYRVHCGKGSTRKCTCQ